MVVLFSFEEATKTKKKKKHKPPLVPTCARVLNHYEGLFIARTGQQVSVAQRFSTVACSADVHDSVFFFFILTPNLSFLASRITLDDP